MGIGSGRMRILLATTNEAKIHYYGERLKEKGIDLVTLRDLKIDVDVDENGSDPVENAVIKARAYNEISHLPTIALDDGLFFDGVPKELQPGTHVRRIGGRRLNDAEMIDYYIGLVNQYGVDGKLPGYFLKGIAIVDQDNVYTSTRKSERLFTSQQSKTVVEGYPLDSIQIILSLNKFKSELTREEEAATIDSGNCAIFEFLLETIRKMESDSSKMLVRS